MAKLGLSLVSLITVLALIISPLNVGATPETQAASASTLPPLPQSKRVPTLALAHENGSPALDSASRLTSFDCSIVTDIPQTECEALVALYNGTNGAAWANRTNWLTAPTASGWFGVQCTAGHVMTVSLPSNQLSGSIPPELGNLANLQSLDLVFRQA